MTTPKQTPVSSGELMKHNWVQRTNSGGTIPLQIVGLLEDFAYVLKPDGRKVLTKYSRLEGVLLSPEILEKCGFEKWDWHDGYITPFMGNHLMIREYNGKILSRTLSVSKDSEGHLGKNGKEFLPPDRITYLHQLQNLYHALTGSHLKVEL